MLPVLVIESHLEKKMLSFSLILIIRSNVKPPLQAATFWQLFFFWLWSLHYDRSGQKRATLTVWLHYILTINRN